MSFTNIIRAWSVSLLLACCAVSAAPPERERLLFGALMGNYWPGNVAKDIQFFELMRDAGVTQTGLGFNWDNIEKKRGEYNWGPWDYAVDMAARHGIGIEGVIVGCPEWALPQSGDLGWLPVALNMPRDECMGDFEKFIRTLARRYAGKVERFTFWNEPNGYNMAPTVSEKDPKYKGKIEKYAKYLKIAYAALKEGNPKAVLACGGIDSSGKSGTWLTGLYENGGGEFMDAVAIHPYTNDPPYIDEAYIRKTREIMEKYSDADKPIWINEYGTYNPGKQVIETVFDTVKKKYPYVESMMLHTFQDFQGGDGLQPWGLIDLGIKIKPTGGYEAFKAYPKPARKGAPAVPDGSCEVFGRLTDMQLRRGLADAYVVAMPGAYYAKTDRQGRYRLKGLPEGEFVMTTPGGSFSKIDPIKVTTSPSKPARADFNLTRDVIPLAPGESFDPARDSADIQRLNLVVNGSLDQMAPSPYGPIGLGWAPFNTVQQLTYTAGAGIGGEGLSQMLGHSGAAVQEGIFQVVPTIPGQKYRLTFWFAYRGQGRVGDPNNCSRAGVDLSGGEWATVDPKSGKTRYGYPKTLKWLSGDLAVECDKRAGGQDRGGNKWYKFGFDFTAEGPKASIWLQGSAEEGQNSRKFFDEISVVPVDE